MFKLCAWVKETYSDFDGFLIPVLQNFVVTIKILLEMEV